MFFFWFSVTFLFQSHGGWTNVPLFCGSDDTPHLKSRLAKSLLLLPRLLVLLLALSSRALSQPKLRTEYLSGQTQCHPPLFLDPDRDPKYTTYECCTRYAPNSPRDARVAFDVTAQNLISSNLPPEGEVLPTMFVG
ncbi:uncharacterized protein B0T23DRAFT_152913 [Neurospora hispaniola]|uniref:Uncharacterized protein n=1 Tax=Neurospora hispaniola TaxID=588809 RepID=A0AAJ0I8I9_9PEZI|nr:hypothetical protein B0T23DRAFT_152913 [Neurospora hispaniola]